MLLDEYSIFHTFAETINGVYKTEVMRSRGPWGNLEVVAIVALEWPDSFNNRRLLELTKNITPVELTEYAPAYQALAEARSVSASGVNDVTVIAAQQQ